MARPKSKNVGVIGLGIIGSRVAATLRNRGFQVFVWNRTPRLEPNFVGSPAEVAELCNFIQIFVSDDGALLEIVRLLVPVLTAQHVVVAHCTVAPDSMRSAAQLVERRGARFLEAPFTGSKVAAENGQLVYYIGGDELALKQARPILEASSREIIPIGEIGSASIIKVATNIVTAATAQIAAEALAIVRRAGIAGEIFSRAMKSNASNSGTIEMKAPMMLKGDFEPHFSVKHMLKDVRIAEKLARGFGLEVPMAEVASDALLAEMKQGRGDADYSSVAQRYFPVSAKPFMPAIEKPRVERKEEAIEKTGESETKTEKLKEETKVGEGGPFKIETEAAKPIASKPAETIREEAKLAEQPPEKVEAEPAKPGEDSQSGEAESEATASEEPKLAEVAAAEKKRDEPRAQSEAASEPTTENEEADIKKEEISPVNLSGGLRGWLSRLVSGRP